MLKVVVAAEEHFNEETSEFTNVGGFELELEHSLISLSKWESKYQKPFLGRNDKPNNEILDYVEMMILSPVYPADWADQLSSENWDEIREYIESSQSATTFGEMPERKGRGETITSELIYYWMVLFQIPFDVETWHLNRLFSLIRICNIKNQPKEKNRMSKQEIARRNREINDRRRAELGTRG